MSKVRNFLVVFFVLLGIAGLNLYLYFNKVSISGFSVKGSAIEIGKKLVKFDFSTLAFIVTWFLIFIVIIIFYVRFLKGRKKEKTNQKIKIEKPKGEASTDLDALYNLLEQRKRLKLPTIAKSFKISKEKALEWCKILENYGLANIEYPAFSDAEVEIRK